LSPRASRNPYLHAPNELDAPACDRAGKNALLASSLGVVTCPICLRFPERWTWTVRAAHRILGVWLRKLYQMVFRRDLHG